MPPSRRSAFTLVELLVVIGIIGVLVAIVIGVAASVAEGGRARATEGVLRALDQSLDIYVEQRGGIPSALYAMSCTNLVKGRNEAFIGWALNLEATLHRTDADVRLR